MFSENLKNIAVIGAPLDLGAGKRGGSLGPDALRYAGILKRINDLGLVANDKGDITTDKDFYFTKSDSNLKNLDSIVKASNLLYKQVDEAMEKSEFPLILGGDHSLAIGSVKAAMSHYKNLGLIWIDAHADINTDKSTMSGNIHGMPVSALLGLGCEDLIKVGKDDLILDASNIVYIGPRDIDPEERMLLKTLNIKVYTLHEIDRMGIRKVVEEAIAYLSSCDGVHVSLDIDVMDPKIAPGTGTKVNGGLTHREGRLLMEFLSKSNNIVSMDIMEVNPILDDENKTAELATTLALSLLGENLL